MPLAWDTIGASACRPVHGFHEIEAGFVWSTLAFGLFFPPGGRETGAVVLAVHNPHAEITLTCRLDGRTFAVRVPPGEQRILLDADCAGRFVDFAISPKLLLGSDVRELGLMIRRIFREATPGPASRLVAVGTAPPGEPDGLERLRAAARTNGRHVVGSFLREGWFAARHRDGAIQLQLHVPPWMPLAAADSAATLECGCGIGGREETVTFDRDHVRPNVFRSTLPLRRIAGRAVPLLELEEPFDIVLRPNAAGRYRGQGVHWRGRGADALPPAANVERVAGRTSLENFLLHGASWLVKLEQLAGTLLPTGLAGARRIVDWGCGCARISRHLPPELRPRAIGFDIDRMNVEWCRTNVHGMRFETCAVEPPLDLEDDSVDVLFAHSVLTHLGEEHQHRWLAEIRRVLRPGGLAFLTVLAELSWYQRFYPTGRTPEAIADYLERGFVDHGWQYDVGVDADCPGAYVQVSHGMGYVRSAWSGLFEIVDWIDGFAGMQTLVVVRKRPAPAPPADARP
jgi:SAM-dependent methyltransferase